MNEEEKLYTLWVCTFSCVRRRYIIIDLSKRKYDIFLSSEKLRHLAWRKKLYVLETRA